MSNRMICRFSCGAASAVATKLAIAQFGGTHEIHIINAFIVEEHEIGELARAAACYAANATGFRLQSLANLWPWDRAWWKPTTPRGDLVKSGALILAEIERIDRAAASAGDQS